jgi:hypothetical protein
MHVFINICNIFIYMIEKTFHIQLLELGMVLRRQGVSYNAAANILLEQQYIQNENHRYKVGRSSLYRSFATALREFSTIMWHYKHGRVCEEIVQAYGTGRNVCPCSGAVAAHVGPTIMVPYKLFRTGSSLDIVR